MKGFNWQIIVGFLLSLFAFASVPLIFSQYSVSTDFRLLGVGLFAVAAVFVFVGLRRGFAVGRGKFSKIAAAALALVSGAVFGLFVFLAFFMATSLPKSTGAPQVGQKAHDFTLADTTGNQVSLNGSLVDKKGVLLVFYRGYW
ncbi:MAG: hypothetical protein ACKVQW_12445 [Pyrinomonadaceae bacterium]